MHYSVRFERLCAEARLHALFDPGEPIQNIFVGQADEPENKKAAPWKKRPDKDARDPDTLPTTYYNPQCQKHNPKHG
jgi:hypothetical protein